ncbi:uncharacterized protein CTRU02_212146 [Colletotrichum truncatum]|uniref:Uncharacterized protein n=1 Tax=Colletotrichum truncatum TaxID=5467 RepID=A0ACC3YMQ3_COLTU
MIQHHTLREVHPINLVPATPPVGEPQLPHRLLRNTTTSSTAGSVRGFAYFVRFGLAAY